ncbi:hypothetical protein [Photobacterium leiognathi]|uniref:hypothetical protein n=1 Tax=Photobacterium leiognathi TaxID=553611 RepID=UPI002980DE89|nr:hypothetical protein [Photobacterium leiognathi]
MELYIRISHYLERVGFVPSVINNLYLPLFTARTPHRKESIKETALNVLNGDKHYDPETRCFKGVDKSLLTPLIVIKGIMANKVDIPPTECSAFEDDVYALESKDIVKLNPKNLMKYYSYPERDAKILFGNITKCFHDHKNMYLIKKPFINNDCIEKCMLLAERTRFRAAWFNDKVEQFEKILRESDEVDSAEIKQVLVNKSLNVKRLGWWMEVAKDHCESNGGDWSSMSSTARKHQIINSIRHNAIGYHQSYSTHREKGFYALAYDIVMRDIINTFPTLRSVAQAQFDSKLKDELNPLPHNN